MSSSTDFLVRIIGDSTKGISEVNKFGSSVKTELGGAKGAFSGFASVAGGAIAALGLTAVAGKVVDFAGQSVEAYKEAEAAQQRLVDAYDRFPALADVNIEKLQALNTELSKKTRFDDDATASGQAVLAQFGLTGDQLQQLTPLMQDYAAKTGKDLPTAAEDLGKAILGQGKALKGIGIEFTDSGSAAGNFEQLMSGLRTQVGGFAEGEASTAEGKAAILANQFGEVQETIGAQLLPVLTELGSFVLTNIIPGMQAMADWAGENKDLLLSLAIGIGAATIAYGAYTAAIALSTAYKTAAAAATGGLTIAQWAWNAAVSANPIGLIILAIVALVAAIVWLVLNWDTVVAWITTVWSGFITWITGVMEGFAGWWNGLWSGIFAWVADVWNGFNSWLLGVINGFLSWWNGIWSAVGAVISNVWNNYIVAPITNAINWVTTMISSGMSMISNVWSATWNGLGAIVKGIWNGVLGWIQGGINGAIDLINGMIRSVNDIGGAIGINLSLIPHVSLPRLAGGGVTTGPMMAIIGDNPGGREYVEPVDRVAARLERVAIESAGAAGGNGAALSRDDMDYMADRIGQVAAKAIYPMIIKGAQSQIKIAFNG